MTRPVVLINSGAYVPQELSAEFGALPPTFLPVGMRRLYELQLEALESLDADVYVTIPASFSVPSWDAARLEELSVRLIRSPDGLELGAALLHALASIGLTERPLRILHGDTLIFDLELELDDIAGVAEGGDGYRWAPVHQVNGRISSISRPEIVAEAKGASRLAGYFAFASAARFAEALALSGGDFFDALNRYAVGQSLTAREVARWYDFGHVQTFFRSRRVVTTERAFNSLHIGESSVRKRSDRPAKLQAEAHWFRTVPPELRPYTARLLGEGEDARGYFYDTEYEYMPTLAELFVFGRLQPASWQRILASCKAFLDAAAGAIDSISDPDALHKLVVRKTADRLEQHARAAGIDLGAPNTINGRLAPSLQEVLREIEYILAEEPPRPSVMHGDFCFSNILYDFRTDQIRLIDPRGFLEDGTPSIYGDVRYDAAKLMHSVAGRYDVIIAGRCVSARSAGNHYTLRFAEDDDRAVVERIATAMEMGGVPLSSRAVAAVTVTLFLSMVPLHADRPDRQTAFIANGLRLFLDLQDRAT